MSTEADEIRVETEIARMKTDDALTVEARRAHIREERMDFPPLYVAIGVYRLLTDKKLLIPVWQNCKHGVVRGAVVGLGWVSYMIYWSAR